MDLDEEELRVIYFVSGYCGNLEKSALKCAECYSHLLAGPHMTEADSENSFFRNINRGGLMAPSNVLYPVCCATYHIFCQLKTSQSFFDFMRCSSPVTSFVKMVVPVITNDAQINLSAVCNHDIMPIWQRIITHFFNTLAKNFTQNTSCLANPLSNRRKVTKLTANKL